MTRREKKIVFLSFMATTLFVAICGFVVPFYFEDKILIAGFVLLAWLIQVSLIFLVLFKEYFFKKSDDYLSRPIDLDEGFRALTTFGTQPPVYKSSLLKTELVKIESKKYMSVHSQTVLVEHWDGGDLNLTFNNSKIHLKPRQILRLSGMEKIEFQMHDLDDQNPGYVMIHEIGENLG